MEELTFELSLKRGVDFGNPEDKNGKWAFQTAPTT